MRSPFPGMDPYLESRWSDVHATLIAMLKETIQPKLPASLRARTEERILLEESGDERPQSYRADIAVVDLGKRPEPGSSPQAATATVEPIVVEYEEGPAVERHIQIIDVTAGNRVVTAIEVLSRWNKGPGRLNADYLKKLDDYARGSVSVVELDLLRHPRRGRLMVGQEDLPTDRRTPYLACVRRAWAPRRWEIYPLELRRPLPALPIPLRENEPQILVELQPLLDRVYTAGGHDDIDYTKPCDPPLEGEDAAWAEQLLREAGRR